MTGMTYYKTGNPIFDFFFNMVIQRDDYLTKFEKIMYKTT